MRAALLQAKKGLGTTSPNPAVGAVLVSRNRIIARGHHRRAGGDHAEIDCLGKLDDPIPAEAVLYVTLEPCSPRGRTATFANYIIQRGVRRVVIGAVDPNPKHRGRAIGLFFFSSRRRHTRSVSAFLLNRSSDLKKPPPVAFKVMCLLPITIL